MIRRKFKLEDKVVSEVAGEGQVVELTVLGHYGVLFTDIPLKLYLTDEDLELVQEDHEDD